jgi:hypothetical protein
MGSLGVAWLSGADLARSQDRVVRCHLSLSQRSVPDPEEFLDVGWRLVLTYTA